MAGIDGGKDQQVTPDDAAQVEDATKQDKGERLVGGIRCNELGHEGEEKEHHLGVEHIGQHTLPVNLAIGEGGQGDPSLHGTRCLLAQQGEPQIDQVDGASQLDKGKQLGRGTEQGRQTEGRRQHMHHDTGANTQRRDRTGTPPLRATAQHDQQGVGSRHDIEQQPRDHKQCKIMNTEHPPSPRKEKPNKEGSAEPSFLSLCGS